MNQQKFFLVVVDCGHVGTRRSIEIDRYFKDYDIISVYHSAIIMPRCKKKSSSIKYVKEISYDDYVLGKIKESTNLYLSTV